MARYDARRAASDATFWIGRRSATTSRLPYVVRLLVSGEGRIFLAVRDTWPRGTDVFCHQLPSWPDDAEIIEEVPIEACWRVGAAVHLVLRRPRQRRSLFVWTRKGERTLVFWRSEASMRRARPGIRVPLARDFGERLTIAIDSGERYPWRFVGRPVTAERRRLPVGDYALVVDEEVTAAVERKTPQDLASAATGGQLGLTLAELGQTRHAAIVVEGRLSDVIKEADRVRPGWLMNIIAALQVEHPRVAWIAHRGAVRAAAARHRPRGGDRGDRMDQPLRGAALWSHAGHRRHGSRGARQGRAAAHHRRGNETTLRGTIVVMPPFRGPEAVDISLTVNGQRATAHLPPQRSLLELLRGPLGLTGTKLVCNAGNCGACTVLVEDRPVYSCITLAVACQGKRVETIEGISKDGALHPVQEAFIDHDAYQCGFCTPGQVMSIVSLLRTTAKPTEDEMRRAVTGNLCRCGAYVNIVRAGMSAARRSK